MKERTRDTAAMRTDYSAVKDASLCQGLHRRGIDRQACEELHATVKYSLLH